MLSWTDYRDLWEASFYGNLGQEAPAGKETRREAAARLYAEYLQKRNSSGESERWAKYEQDVRDAVQKGYWNKLTGRMNMPENYDMRIKKAVPAEVLSID